MNKTFYYIFFPVVSAIMLFSMIISCEGNKNELSQEEIDSININKADSIKKVDSLANIGKIKKDSIARINKITEVNRILNEENVTSVDNLQYFYDDINFVRGAIAEEQNIKLKTKWTKKLKAIQSRLFPKARRIWAQGLKRDMWVHDVDVIYSGKTITFIGAMFALNENKQDAYILIADALKDLRFKKVIFKWYKYDDEYTYYTIHSKNDTEL